MHSHLRAIGVRVPIAGTNHLNPASAKSIWLEVVVE
jgi:hypothetical protein